MATYIISGLVAVVLAAMLIGVPHIVGIYRRRKYFAELSELRCPQCEKKFGDVAIRNGKDSSPWEELWGTGPNDTLHCRPMCRIVRCLNCSASSQIRHQTDGVRFGPRLSVSMLEGRQIPK